MAKHALILTTDTRRPIKEGDTVRVGDYEEPSGYYGGSNVPRGWREHTGKVYMNQAGNWMVEGWPYVLAGTVMRRLVETGGDDA